MSVFFRQFRHLLPSGRAWSLTIEKTLRRFFEGLAAGAPSDARDFVDEVHAELDPDTTTELALWESQHGITYPSSDEAERRATLAAAWSATGGQSTYYLQSLLQSAGFPVYVHEWWSSGPPYVARNPNDYLDNPTWGTATCGNPASTCGSGATANREITSGSLEYLVNKDLTNRAPPPLPTDSAKFPFFVYVGEETFPDRALIPSARRAEFEHIILRYFPAHLWVGLLVDFYEGERVLVDDYGAILLDDSGNILTTDATEARRGENLDPPPPYASSLTTQIPRNASITLPATVDDEPHAIVAWVYYDGVNDARIASWPRWADDQYREVFYIQPTGAPRWIRQTNSGSGFAYLNASVTVSAGWHLVTVSVPASRTTTPSFRVDGSGTPIAASWINGATTTPLSASPDGFVVGNFSDTAPSSRIVKNVALVIGGELSDAQHEAIWALGRDGDLSGLAFLDHYWRLSDPTETTTVADRIGAADLSVVRYDNPGTSEVIAYVDADTFAPA